MKTSMGVEFKDFMENYARDIGGQYDEYDDNKSVIIVPLGNNRYQTVLGRTVPIEKLDKTGLEFTSKVCEFSDDIDLKLLLEENASLVHAKFVVENNYIKVEASAFLDECTDMMLQDIIQEVANVADDFEYRLTGLDVH